MVKKHDNKPHNKWQEFAQEQEAEVESNDAEIEQQPEVVEPDHAVGEVEFTAKNMHELENKISRLEMEVQRYKDQIIRSQAEMENLNRQSERKVSDALKYGSQKLLADLIPVGDSLMHGLQDQAAQDTQTMRQGMQMTLDLLQKTLSKHGVSIISPEKGDAFDPQKHEAMTMMADPNAESNTIIDVLQIGYELNGRVVRAARVIVAQ